MPDVCPPTNVIILKWVIRQLRIRNNPVFPSARPFHNNSRTSCLFSLTGMTSADAHDSLLYQTQRILLYRPLLTTYQQPTAIAATSLEICRGAATTAHEIFSMWGRTFGFVNMVFFMMYCCFVCAGVDVILLRVSNGTVREEALGRVLLGLEILEAASTQGPGESDFRSSSAALPTTCCRGHLRARSSQTRLIPLVQPFMASARTS